MKKGIVCEECPLLSGKYSLSFFPTVAHTPRAEEIKIVLQFLVFLQNFGKTASYTVPHRYKRPMLHGPIKIKKTPGSDVHISMYKYMYVIASPRIR